MPDGVISTTPSEFATDVIADVHPDVAEPTTRETPSEISAFIAFRHSVESPWSSFEFSAISYICPPTLTPPAALICSTASSTPFSMCVPYTARLPVIGPITPRVIVPAVSPEGAASVASASVVSAATGVSTASG